ncbi:hypothetical protein N8563_01485 [bacterium]|nr:hypothetical protein [bacterium]
MLLCRSVELLILSICPAKHNDALVESEQLLLSSKGLIESIFDSCAVSLIGQLSREN